MVLEHLSDQALIRRQKLGELQQKDVEPYGQKYPVTHKTSEVILHFRELEEEGTAASVYGRIISKRGHGKASFAHIEDGSGRLQIYLREEQVGSDQYNLYQLLDIGDIIGVTGTVFKTRKGEITVNVSSFRLLTKSLRPLPEKWHGLKDVELRYRHRHLDLMVNPEVREVFITRSRIIHMIREFLVQRGYLEVETPVMHTVAGGASARPFITHHNALGIDLYLRIATELHLKRLIVGGIEKVFELGRIFRNEGLSTSHNPEFTSVEIYEVNADYEDMMDLTEEMITSITREIHGTLKLNYQGRELDLTPPWPRRELSEVIREITGVEFSAVQGDDAARKLAAEHGLEVDKDSTKGEIMYTFFEKYCEDKLWNPLFVKDYPVEVSPLAQRCRENPQLTYRFETFIAGKEIANAFTELTDPLDQRKRFVQQAEKRDSGDEEAHMMDEDFLVVMEYGMAPTGGLGIGVDRLVMVLTDRPSIRDVILFPTLRPREQQAGRP